MDGCFLAHLYPLSSANVCRQWAGTEHLASELGQCTQCVLSYLSAKELGKSTGSGHKRAEFQTGFATSGLYNQLTELDDCQFHHYKQRCDENQM